MFGITGKKNKKINEKNEKKNEKNRKRCIKTAAALLCLLLLALQIAGCGFGSTEGGSDKRGEAQGADTQSEGNEDSFPAGKKTNTDQDSPGTASLDQEGTGDNKEDSTEKGNDNTDNPPVSSPDSTGKTLPVKEPLHVGDELTDGKLKIIYMASGEYQEPSEYQQPPAGYKYIYVQFAFQNTGSKYDCPISLFSFNCYADSFSAQAFYGGEKELPSSLSSGRSTIGNLYFSVPEDAGNIEIEYQPAHLNQDRIRFAYEGEKDAGLVLLPDTERTGSAFKVGDAAASSRQRILYLSCEKDDSDNEFIRPGEGCSFYTLTFEFENLESEERQVSIHDFSCYADGFSCRKNLFRDDYLSASVSGGRKARGTVTFEIPDDAQIVEVEYDTGSKADQRVIFTVR